MLSGVAFYIAVLFIYIIFFGAMVNTRYPTNKKYAKYAAIYNTARAKHRWGLLMMNYRAPNHSTGLGS